MAVLVVSYSRLDRSQVRPLIQLLRAGIPEIRTAVFWDDDLEPGDLWYAQITRNIDDAKRLFVFWCAHSCASAEVKREFTYALDRAHRVIPVILDDTPLVPELAQIQGIDLRPSIHHGRGELPRLIAAPSRKWHLVLSAFLLLLVLGIVFSRQSSKGVNVPLPAGAEPTVGPSPLVLEDSTILEGGRLTLGVRRGLDDLIAATGRRPSTLNVVVTSVGSPGETPQARAITSYLITALALSPRRVTTQAVASDPSPSPVSAGHTIVDPNILKLIADGENEEAHVASAFTFPRVITLGAVLSAVLLALGLWRRRRSSQRQSIIDAFKPYLT